MSLFSMRVARTVSGRRLPARRWPYLVAGAVLLFASACNEREGALTTAVGPSASPAPQAFTLSVSPQGVIGAGSVQATVGLTLPAPAGLKLSLASDTPEVVLPSSVTVPAGSSTVPITISTQPVSTDRTARLRAWTGEGQQVDATLQLWATLPTALSWTSNAAPTSFNQPMGRATPPTSTFSAVCSGNQVSIEVRTPSGSNQNLSFTGSAGAGMRPGTYDFTSSTSSPRFFASGLACSVSSGRFVVHEATLTAAGDVLRWRATFEYTCSSSSGSSVRGEVTLSNVPKPYTNSCTVTP